MKAAETTPRALARARRLAALRRQLLVAARRVERDRPPSAGDSTA